MKQKFTKKRVVIAAGALLAATIGISGVAAATVIDDNDQPITGDALREASRVAIDHLGEGRVTETEIDDEDSKYEVEVLLPSGREVDVQLDENFNVVSSETESADEDD